MNHDDCIFCKIARGEIPCSKIYETEEVLAFLDIAPVNKGHALIIPKAHHPTILELPPELGAAMFTAMSKVGDAVMKAVKAEGLNVMMNNFEAAGQLVHHAHFHLIPRFADDGLELWPQKPYENMDEMGTLALAVSDLIS